MLQWPLDGQAPCTELMAKGELRNTVKDSVVWFLQWICCRTFCCFTVGDGDSGGALGGGMKFKVLSG